MIKVGVGVGISDQASLDYALEYAKNGLGVQLSFFQPKTWFENFRKTLIAFEKKGLTDRIFAVHLPTRTPDFVEVEPGFAHTLAGDLALLNEDVPLVIHPNVRIKDALVTLVYELGVRQTICIENFQYRKKKELRSPLDIAEYCIQHEDKFAMCFDTTHAEEYWYEYPLLDFILRRTKVIHLSNRKQKEQHIPFNSGGADLNLMAFVNDLIPRYKWKDGIIILEYMWEYKYKSWQNAEYVQRLLKEKGNEEGT
jgi:hypothetical protein